MNRITTTHPSRSELKSKYYSMIASKKLLIPDRLKTEKEQFEESWEWLKKDNYLKNGKSFRYRRFRYLYFLPASEEIIHFSATPYYQPPEINKYAKGIDRKFEAVTEEIICNSFLQELIKFDFLQFPINEQKKSEPWLIDLHQTRIVTTESETGEPTPEGIHHDENNFVCIHLIKRENITGGVNGIYNNNRELLESRRLINNLDSIIICDPKVMHGVTPIYPKKTKKLAYRDVLIMGFTHIPKLELPTGNVLFDYKKIKENINSAVMTEHASQKI